MAEGDAEQIAIWNANKAIESLLDKLNAPDYVLFVTGENNFRFRVYPEYKANRIKQPRPIHLQAVKDHLIVNWKAVESEGCEADDLCGIEQCSSSELGIDTMISSIDKDLDMIPGWHYSPEISRKGTIVREAKQYLVSPDDASRFFYGQLLTGDATDNIKGLPGCGKVGATKMLAGLESEINLFQCVRAAYACDQELEMNARCLWIQRKKDENIVDRWKELFGYQKET